MLLFIAGPPVVEVAVNPDQSQIISKTVQVVPRVVDHVTVEPRWQVLLVIAADSEMRIGAVGEGVDVHVEVDQVVAVAGDAVGRGQGVLVGHDRAPADGAMLTEVVAAVQEEEPRMLLARQRHVLA